MPVDISKIVAQSTSSTSPVTSQYDALWGYYTFTQTVQFDYSDTGVSGLSNATIVINGFFTANSEGVEDGDDSAKRTALFAKYSALRAALMACVRKPRPSNVSQIGTSSDERCIALPSKLLNNNSSTVYAIPTSFATTEISPEILRYTVTLTEPKASACKLAIGDDIIDDATVTIICRRPRITYRNFVFANGSEAYVTGIDNRKYTVSGTINGQSSNSCSDYVSIGSNSDDGGSGDGSNSFFDMKSDVVDIISDIINKDKGKVKIKVQSSDGGSTDAFTMMLMNHTVNHSYINGSTNIELFGEEAGSSN